MKNKLEMISIEDIGLKFINCSHSLCNLKRIYEEYKCMTINEGHKMDQYEKKKSLKKVCEVNYFSMKERIVDDQSRFFFEDSH